MLLYKNNFNNLQKFKSALKLTLQPVELSGKNSKFYLYAVEKEICNYKINYGKLSLLKVSLF